MFAISLFWTIAITIGSLLTQLAFVSRTILATTFLVIFVYRLFFYTSSSLIFLVEYKWNSSGGNFPTAFIFCASKMLTSPTLMLTVLFTYGYTRLSGLSYRMPAETCWRVRGVVFRIWKWNNLNVMVYIGDQHLLLLHSYRHLFWYHNGTFTTILFY